jgi:hypothetical protein
MSSYVQPLKNLQRWLTSLNADTASMIRHYQDKTGMKIGIIAEILLLRDRLEKESNPPLYHKYKKLKVDVIHYLDKKITENREDHDSDVLFEIDAIAQTEFLEMRETVIRDIEATSWDAQRKEIVH